MSFIAAPSRSGPVPSLLAAPAAIQRERLDRVIAAAARGLAVAALAACGCATQPQQFRIDAATAPVINRDVNGEPLSMVVHLYQLKDRSAFDLLTFDAATRTPDDRELFGDQFVSRRELVLVPGGSRLETETLAPETRYVGITGFFREPDRQHWRFLVEAQSMRAKGLRFRVEDCHLTLLEPVPLPIPGQPADHRPRCAPAVSWG